MTTSVPPYAGGGTGTQGGAIRPIRIGAASSVEPRDDHAPLATERTLTPATGVFGRDTASALAGVCGPRQARQASPSAAAQDLGPVAPVIVTLVPAPALCAPTGWCQSQADVTITVRIEPITEKDLPLGTGWLNVVQLRWRS